MRKVVNGPVVVAGGFVITLLLLVQCVGRLPNKLIAVPTPLSVSTATAGPITTETPSATVELTGGEHRILGRFNRARRAVGAGPLVVDGCVMGVAKVRAQDMAANQYLAHVSPTGQAAYLLVDAACPGLRGELAEVIARTNAPEEGIYAFKAEEFLASPRHRVLIERPAYDRVGIGVAISDDGFHYFAVIMLYWQD